MYTMYTKKTEKNKRKTNQSNFDIYKYMHDILILYPSFAYINTRHVSKAWTQESGSICISIRFKTNMIKSYQRQPPIHRVLN